MKQLKHIFPLLIFFILISCTKENLKNNSSSANNKLTKGNFVEGQITVVGNEPFTNLALQVNDSTVYKLECNENTKNTLLKHQGELYKIYFSKKIDTKTGIKLLVLKTEKIK